MIIKPKLLRSPIFFFAKNLYALSYDYVEVFKILREDSIACLLLEISLDRVFDEYQPRTCCNHGTDNPCFAN